MWLQPVLLTAAVLVASSWAAEKQIKLEDIESDNLKGSKDQSKVLQQPQFQYQAQLDPQQQLQLQQQLLAQQQQQQLLAQQQYLLAQPAQVLPPGGQFAYYPSLPAFQGNQLQPNYVTVSPEQVQALAAQYQQQQQQQQQQHQPALPQQAYLAALQYVPAAVQPQPQPQPRPQPEQQLLQYQQQQQNYLQQFQGGARVPHSLQPQAPPQLSSPPEAPEPTVQYSSGEVYSTIPYSSKQDYSVQLTNPTPQEQQYNFQQVSPPRLYNPYNALLHPQQQQQKTLFAGGAKSTAAPPVKALPQAGFLPSSSINHPGQGFSFSNYRRGPPSNF